MINNRKDWTNKFNSEGWKLNKGNEQTLFQYDILLKYMPDWLKSEIYDNNLDICDLGCGMGEGIALFKEYFNHSEITGVDFSKYDMEQAKIYRDNSFICADINDFNNHYDIILSPHNLEHFENPFKLLNHVISLADKYLILIIPFQEKNLSKEYSTSRNYGFFPLVIQDHVLVHYKKIDEISSDIRNYWTEKQILIIYANSKNVDINKFSLKQFDNNYFNELKTMKNSYENKINALNNQLDYYHKNVNCLQKKYTSLKKNSQYTKKQMKNIANTKPYRIAYVLHRFSHEFLKGNTDDKMSFLKWIYCKMTKKESKMDFRYNPIMSLVKK